MENQSQDVPSSANLLPPGPLEHENQQVPLVQKHCDDCDEHPTHSGESGKESQSVSGTKCNVEDKSTQYNNEYSYLNKETQTDIVIVGELHLSKNRNKHEHFILIMHVSITILSMAGAFFAGHWWTKDPFIENLKFCSANGYDHEDCSVQISLRNSDSTSMPNEVEFSHLEKVSGPSKEDFVKLNKTITEYEKGLNQCLVETDQLKVNHHNMENRLDITTRNVSVVNQLFGLLNNNALDKETGLIVILCLLVGEVLLGIIIACYVLPQLRRQNENEDCFDGSPRILAGLPNSSCSILNNVKKRQLQREICIISFFKGNQDKHKNLLKSVLANGSHADVLVTPFLVAKHPDIVNIPASRMYLVFVDFNERHIILEEPGKGLGDLKLTTVKAARKMGGEIIIVYDAGTGVTTQNGMLYDKYLTSIDRIDELKFLKSKDCILSISQKFSDSQKKHIQKKVDNIF